MKDMIFFTVGLYLAIISGPLFVTLLHLRWQKEQRKQRDRILCGHRIVDSVNSNQNSENALDFEQLEQTLKNLNLDLHVDLCGCTG